VSFRQFLDGERKLVESALDGLLPPADAWPARLNAALRYAVFAGGKRIRPILARLAHRAAGGDPNDVTEAACGLELIHTYSLVHDDLPALDNDELRRGRPTVHVAYDEATAVLVGDALLTEGLGVLARHPEGSGWAVRRAEAVSLVAGAAGALGMVGGQVEDLEATGTVRPDDPVAAERLERIHRHKTGCLLRASVELGALLAGVGEEERAGFRRYGERLGMAFQVTDDILDATASAQQLGKSPGKDEAAGKLTYVTLYGLERATMLLNELEDELAQLSLELEGPDGDLGALAHFVCIRSS